MNSTACKDITFVLNAKIAEENGKMKQFNAFNFTRILSFMGDKMVTLTILPATVKDLNN